MSRPRVTRIRIHAVRVTLWSVMIPIAIFTGLKSSISFLTFISLAALVESSLTDLEQAWLDKKEARGEARELHKEPE